MNISFKSGLYYKKVLIEIAKDINVTPEYYDRLRQVLSLQKTDIPFVRLGDEHDGGYIMADDLGGGIAYSFGINDDVSWDLDMTRRCYDVFMYDPTIEGLPFQNFRFRFFKEGLAGVKNPDTLMDTLENFIERNGHKEYNNMILKIDIEGAEWDFLSTVKRETMEQFDQILFEFHDMLKARSDSEIEEVLSLLDKINETHQLVHLHGNNCDYSITIDGQCYPNALEATYLKKSKYKTVEYTPNLPIDLDTSNDRGRADLVLGHWNLV